MHSLLDLAAARSLVCRLLVYPEYTAVNLLDGLGLVPCVFRGTSVTSNLMGDPSANGGMTGVV